MRATLLLILGAMLVTVGCSETPSSPTPVNSGSPTSGSPTLRWDLTAAGCSPLPAPSPVPDSTAARITVEPGALLASWSIVSAGDRPSTLYAKFLSAGRDWALCTWDTVDQ